LQCFDGLKAAWYVGIGPAYLLVIFVLFLLHDIVFYRCGNSSNDN